MQKPPQITQELKSNLLLNIKITLLVLPRNTKHLATDGQVCFHRQLFANSVKPSKCITMSVEPTCEIHY